MSTQIEVESKQNQFTSVIFLKFGKNESRFKQNYIVVGVQVLNATEKQMSDIFYNPTNTITKVKSAIRAKTRNESIMLQPSFSLASLHPFHKPVQLQVQVQFWGTCTLIEYLHLMFLYTFTPQQCIEEYCTFTPLHLPGIGTTIVTNYLHYRFVLWMILWMVVD